MDPWIVILADDFEGQWPGPWQRWSNPTWERTDCRALSGSSSVWPAGAGRGAVTPCVDDYPGNLNAWLVYGPFDLSDATAVQMVFQRWEDTAGIQDSFFWYASLDGNNFHGWQSVRNTNGWSTTTFDLSTVPILGDLRGQSQVWVALVMTSDDSIGAEGVFVDDVVLRKQTSTMGAARRAAPVLDPTAWRPVSATRP